YINGNQDKQTTSSIPSSLANSTTIFNIGAENNGTNPFSGMIDEVKVYSGALTADQIKLDMNKSSGQVLGSLSSNTYQGAIMSLSPVGYWRLGESGGSAADSSGNSQTATANTPITYGVSGALLGDSNKAITLNGTTGNFSVADNSTLSITGSFTITTWIKRADT